MVTELAVRTEERSLPSGEILRCCEVERPRGGRNIVLELRPKHGGRSLLEPATGERLVVDGDALPELLELLEGVGD